MAFRSMSTLLKALPKITPPSTFNLLRGEGCIKTLSTCSLTPMTKPTSPRTQIFDQQVKIKGMLLGGQPHHNYHLLSKTVSLILSKENVQIKSLDACDAKRTVIKFSMLKGRRKTVKAVVQRFMRLDWGIWIRPKAGRHKHLWKKGHLRKKRIRQHVFTNAWHTKVLDRMTTKYWHKKKYFVDDPYENYHTRPNFRITKNIKNIDHQFFS